MSSVFLVPRDQFLSANGDILVINRIDFTNEYGFLVVYTMSYLQSDGTYIKSEQKINKESFILSCIDKGIIKSTFINMNNLKYKDPCKIPYLYASVGV